jgi:hypothetical protein
MHAARDRVVGAGRFREQPSSRMRQVSCLFPTCSCATTCFAVIKLGLARNILCCLPKRRGISNCNSETRACSVSAMEIRRSGTVDARVMPPGLGMQSA